jgi:hypothetical protein
MFSDTLMLADIQKNIALVEGYRLRPLVLLINVVIKPRFVWSNGRMTLTGETTV